MKFKGIPKQLCRITKIKKSLVRKIPKSIRFDKDGIFETENSYLIKRLKTKFKVIEDFTDEVKVKIAEVIEEHDIYKTQEIVIKDINYRAIFIEEEVDNGLQETEEKEEDSEEVKGVPELSELSYKELQVLYAAKTGKSAVGVKKDVILKELEE